MATVSSRILGTSTFFMIIYSKSINHFFLQLFYVPKNAFQNPKSNVNFMSQRYWTNNKWWGNIFLDLFTFVDVWSLKWSDDFLLKYLSSHLIRLLCKIYSKKWESFCSMMHSTEMKNMEKNDFYRNIRICYHIGAWKWLENCKAFQVNDHFFLWLIYNSLKFVKTDRHIKRAKFAS